MSRNALPTTPLAESVCDSAMLAAHIFDRGVDNLVDTLRGVAAADLSAFLNVVLTDGARVLGVTWATG